MSIKKKVEQVKETNNLENADFIILTEIWRKDTDEDWAWVATSGLNNEEFTIDMAYQHTKRRRGSPTIQEGIPSN